MRALSELVGEWLEANFNHFIVDQRNQIRCKCENHGWFISIKKDHAEAPKVDAVRNKPWIDVDDYSLWRRIPASDPKFFEIVVEALTEMHLQYVGEFKRG